MAIPNFCSYLVFIITSICSDPRLVEISEVFRLFPQDLNASYSKEVRRCSPAGLEDNHRMYGPAELS